MRISVVDGSRSSANYWWAGFSARAAWMLGLVLLPLVLYGSTLFAEFGLRDDYSILREAHEEPGKVFHGCAAQARPIYGFLLEQSFARLGGIHELVFGRIAAALLLGATAASTAYLLSQKLGWSVIQATLTAALFTMLPGAQVIVSWSICWPFALATFVAILAFFAAFKGLRQTKPRSRYRWVMLAVTLLLVPTLIYPSQTLVYLIPVAALLAQSGPRSWRRRTEEIFHHLMIVGAALAIGFLIAKLSFGSGGVQPSTRIAFETQWWDKLVWLVRAPIWDALGQFVLADHYGRTGRTETLGVALTSTVLLLGCVHQFKRAGWVPGMVWTTSLVVLVVASLAITVIAAERWAPYRTIYATSGVILIFLVMTVRNLSSSVLLKPDRWVCLFLVMGVIAAGWIARSHTHELIAQPQMEELRLVREGSRTIDPARTQDVLILCPTAPNPNVTVVCDDEFGSLSSNSDWTPKEMVKQVLRERFPNLAHAEKRCRMVVHAYRPTGPKWDVVVDLRYFAKVTKNTARN